VSAFDPTLPAVLFPGQGSHTPGMRDAVARRAPELLERCIELVGEDPFPRVAESTRFAQPALFCASMAAWDELCDMGVKAGVAAGHSLGELAALTAAGVLERDEALQLVVTRGRLMSEAAIADGDGGMLAVIGGTLDDAEAIANESGMTVANDNAPGQVVLSGPRAALERAEESARARGRRTLPVAVAGAFHSAAMEPVVAPFHAALEAATINEPAFPVFSCASAKPFVDVAAEIAAALTHPVRWRDTMLALHAAGATRFIETGPGKVLARMGKRILPDCPVETPLEDAVHA
jgi:[acyl-carrier-protein] S-malonyltransferase